MDKVILSIPGYPPIILDPLSITEDNANDVLDDLLSLISNETSRKNCKEIMLNDINKVNIIFGTSGEGILVGHECDVSEGNRCKYDTEEFRTYFRKVLLMFIVREIKNTIPSNDDKKICIT